MEIIGEEKQMKSRDFHGRSLKSIKQGLGRLLGRRSITITEYDPTYKVAYLGNVLTGWAKGDSCTEKPLNTLWKNYTSSSKPDVQMKLIVTQSGLKALTKEHGLTEYWSHRITYCCAPPELPKIFCWVYRHEGRKLKQELRCHAVLCAKESVARQIADQLQARLTQALIEFKRDKISRQNARLSLANSVYDNPSLPRRKILLSTGCHNYRPPLERSKSAPKLMAIEESLEEEEDMMVGGCCESKKFAKRVDPRSKYATYRNLSYSNRGNRLGGLHSAKSWASTVPCRTSPLQGEKENSSQYAENAGADVVEPNPFGCNKDCDLLDEFEAELTLEERHCDRTSDDNDQQPDQRQQIVDINENVCSADASKFFHSNSWSSGDPDQYPSCPSYADTVADRLEELCEYATCVRHASQYDSLVRSRRRLFEIGDEKGSVRTTSIERGDEGSPRQTLVQNRRKLFENGAARDRTVDRAESGIFGDVDSALQFDLGEESRDSLECVGGGIGSVDDESTPSLQSISSGSDTSSPRDAKIEFAKNYDLDSLWEEDSDESGFVESIGQDANDDKIRDLPHHHLMKSCILSSKSRCVEV